MRSGSQAAANFSQIVQLQFDIFDFRVGLGH
jgi:hypothetical protein